MAFEIGDKVIYPNHGLGIIERIETKTIMGTTCGFYQLRMANETTVFVPVDNVDGVGLRRAVTDSEVERLFVLLGDGKIDSHQNWKGRFKDNSDRMRTGSIYDVVEVLKSLTFLAKSKSLSFREKRMLDRAKFLVVSEMTEVLNEKTPEVEGKVEQALESCFATKARNAAKAKASGPVPAPVPVPPPAPVYVAAPVVLIAKAIAATNGAKAPKVAEAPRVAAPPIRAAKPVAVEKPVKVAKAAVKVVKAARTVKASKPAASPRASAVQARATAVGRSAAKSRPTAVSRPAARGAAAPRRAARAS